jgi:type III secretion system FlhB-like substrate exporter
MQLMSRSPVSPAVAPDADTVLTVVDRDEVAGADAATIRSEAIAEADRIVTDAKREAFQIHRSANDDAQALVASARAEVAQIIEVARNQSVPADESRSAVVQASTASSAPLSPYDVVDDPEPEAPSPFDEPILASRYTKHAGEIPRLGEDAGRGAVATATSLREMLRR